MNGISASLIAFATIFGGAFIGVWLRHRLPEQHLGDATKDIVRLGTGLLGTLSALVLGLLIASANSSYDTQSTYVRRLTANLILLDEILAQYGPETRTARDLLRRSTGPLVDRIWHRNAADVAKQGPFRASTMAEMAYASIRTSPRRTTHNGPLRDRRCRPLPTWRRRDWSCSPVPELPSRRRSLRC